MSNIYIYSVLYYILCILLYTRPYIILLQRVLNRCTERYIRAYWYYRIITYIKTCINNMLTERADSSGIFFCLLAHNKYTNTGVLQIFFYLYNAVCVCVCVCERVRVCVCVCTVLNLCWFLYKRA